MGIVILSVIAAAVLVGVTVFVVIARGNRPHRRHIRGVPTHDDSQHGPLWLGRDITDTSGSGGLGRWGTAGMGGGDSGGGGPNGS